MTLKPRQEWLLRAVVEEFIASGSPVGSRHLSQTSRLGVAPSTIRNDLSVLEDDGLLEHPHTSAGRVPTEAGYRHYVDVDRARAARSQALVPSSPAGSASTCTASSTRRCARRQTSSAA